LEKQFPAWVARAKLDDLAGDAKTLVVRATLNEGQGDEVKVETAGAAKKRKASAPLAWRDGGKLGKAPAFEKDAQIDLGDVANFEKDKRFSAGAWVNVPDGLATGAIVGRFDDRGDRRQGWLLFF